MARTDRRIWGWWFFDWASQPYSTLLLTFIFAPYMAQIMGDGTAAQVVWGYGNSAAGIVIAVCSPLLGAIADRTGGRMRFILLFSVMYVLGAWGLWYAAPGDVNIWFVMLCFAVGLIGMEFATTFSNAMLPDLGTPKEIGRISGSGWAFGYMGGVLALVVMLAFFAEGANGRTLIGIAPLFGLDPDAREGTRAVGPFVAIWYAIFMIPFFLWVREPVKAGAVGIRTAARGAWPNLMATLWRLPRRRSLFAFLGASMFYRDALNGMYAFGGLFAAGVLGWSVVEVGLFGILAAVTGAIFAWLGGKADSRFGPRPVIALCVLVLTAVALAVVFVSRERVFGLAVGPDSRVPDLAFYLLGALIGAAGGALQSASRTMMVTQADPARITEGFGLYALSGKATSFMAPFLIAVVTAATGSQQAGIIPLVVLFLIGLVLLFWVKRDGDFA
jgi:UMF1 family MFS transporter